MATLRSCFSRSAFIGEFVADLAIAPVHDQLTGLLRSGGCPVTCLLKRLVGKNKTPRPGKHGGIRRDEVLLAA